MDIGDYITLAIACISVYLAWKKAPKESRKLEADSDNSHAQAAEKYAEAAASMASQYNDVIKRMAELEAQVRLLQSQKIILEDQITALRIIVRDLIRQLKAAGIEPVHAIPEGSEIK